MKNSVSDSTKPWWKFGYVWFIIAGPAIVVVAGFVTLYLAITSPNEIVSDDRYNENFSSTASGKNASNMAPAVQGRNHAATGAAPINK
jgi:hypothetical protein